MNAATDTAAPGAPARPGDTHDLHDALPDAVLRVDAHGLVLDLKPAASDPILGPDAIAVGRHLGDLLPARALQPIRRAMRDALATRAPQELECVVEHDTGRRFWEVRVVAAGPSSAYVVVHDVTARRRYEDEVRELNAQLERRVADRTKELAAASRELEAFLVATVDGLGGPLAELEALVEDGAAPRPVLLATIDRMRHTVEGLAELARVGRADVRRERVSLTALAREIGARLAASAPERGVRLIVRDALDAHADPALLGWALEELLENAFRFTEQRSEATIEVGAADAGGEVAFFVRDDGAGFEPASAHRIWRPFERLHDGAGPTRKGLGLAIVARVVERHGGRVWADSRLGAGATFYFTLPLPEAP